MTEDPLDLQPSQDREIGCHKYACGIIRKPSPVNVHSAGILQSCYFHFINFNMEIRASLQCNKK